MAEETQPKHYATISTKLPTVDLINLKKYMEKFGVSNQSEFIRKAILDKLNSGHVSHIAGKNKIEYNSKINNFSWKIELDTGEEQTILESLPLEFIQDLQEQLSFELNKRAESLSMKKKGSIAVPRRLVK